MTQHPQDCRSYVTKVLTIYTMLPETPARARAADRKLAEGWFRAGVTIHAAESALLLAQIRRMGRPAGYAKLAPIRSLYYFVPVLEEVMENPLPEGYVEYIKSKLRKLESPDQKRLPVVHSHAGT